MLIQWDVMDAAEVVWLHAKVRVTEVVRALVNMNVLEGAREDVEILVNTHVQQVVQDRLDIVNLGVISAID